MTTIKQDKRARPAAVELRDDALDRAAGGVLASGGIGRGVLAGDFNGDGRVDLVDLAIAKPTT